VANHYYYYYLLAVAAMTFVMAAGLLQSSSFAQQDNATQLNATGTDARYVSDPVTEGTGIELNATGTDAPVLEQISDKGIYRVQLKWPLTFTDPQNALQVEIVFLNASAPLPTNNTIPQREGNETGSGTEAGLTVPETIGGEPEPIESYDMIIYTPDGNKLWEKLDQPGLGGRGTQRIVLESDYTGPVTIQISDIRPGGNANETATAGDIADSVTFTTTIVPEFPIATVLLAIGITATIVALGRRRFI
jgi:hypothetical protein